MKTTTIKFLSKKILFISVIAVMLLPTLVSCNFTKVDEELIPIQDTTVSDTITRIQIFNATDTAVTVWITLGATDGCLQHANQIPFVTDTLGNLVGSFVLNAKDSTIAYAPNGLGYNGNISFNTQPLNCATAQFPNGVNLFEFIVNNSFQSGCPQNTIDISCVAGVNCFIRANLYGGNSWNASSLYPNVQSIINGTKMRNSGLVGVYPFSCDVCTGMDSPPSCDDDDSDKQKVPICNVQRNAVGSGGGVIKVIYLGNMQPLE